MAERANLSNTRAPIIPARDDASEHCCVVCKPIVTALGSGLGGAVPGKLNSSASQGSQESIQGRRGAL